MDGYGGGGSNGHGGDGYDAGFQSSSGQEGSAVFISNLQWWTTDAELEALCSPYGQVTGIRFIEDRSCGKSRGMAVVEFAAPESAQACINGLNGRDINGRPCRVNHQVQRGAAGPATGGGIPGRGGMRGGAMGMGGRGGRGGGGRGMMGMEGGMGMDPSMGMGMWPGMMPGMMMPQMGMQPGMMGMQPGMPGGFQPPPPPQAPPQPQRQ